MYKQGLTVTSHGHVIVTKKPATVIKYTAATEIVSQTKLSSDMEDVSHVRDIDRYKYSDQMYPQDCN